MAMRRNVSGSICTNLFLSCCILESIMLTTSRSYVLYHSLLAVVKHCYRPSEDGDELEARRDLTTAMRALSAVTR